MNRICKIAVATDLHFLAPGLSDEGKAFQELLRFSDGRLIREGVQIAGTLFRDMEYLRPDLVLVTGDLTLNGEKESHAYLAEGFHRLQKKGIPTAILPGNHDLENMMAGAYLGDEGHPVPSVTGRQFCRLYGITEQKDRFLRDPGSMGGVYLLDERLWVLCVDVNGNDAVGEVSEKTLAWAETVLADAKRRGVRVIGASHQNVLEHNSLISQGYIMAGAKKLLALYRKYGVRLHLSGHMHVQHWKRLERFPAPENRDAEEMKTDGFTEIVTSALCIPPCQYGLLTVFDSGWFYQALPVGGGRFEDREEDFLLLNRQRLRYDLSGVRLPAYRERLADGMARLNLAYYSGRLPELKNREWIRAAWKRCVPDSFWNIYADSMFEEPVKDERYCCCV